MPTAALTLERLARPVGLVLLRMDMQALMASLRGLAPRNGNDFNAILQTFVGKNNLNWKNAQLLLRLRWVLLLGCWLVRSLKDVPQS